MNPFFQIVIIAYLYFVVPLLFGVLEAALFRMEKKCVSEIVTNGYLIMLAVFWAIAVVFINQRQPLSVLAKVWMVLTLVISILALIIGLKILKEVLIESKELLASGKKIMFVAMLVSMILSIGFTRPATEDRTVLIVNTSVETDSMYLVNPFSGDATGMLDATGAMSPVEMLYATGVILTGIDSQILVYYVLPVVQLIIFFLAVWRIASALLEKEEHRVWFELITIAIYWMTTYMENRALITGIFLNSWNGLTILSCIVLPLVFAVVIKWMSQAEMGIRNIPAKLEKCMISVVLLLAGQLANNKGGLYVGLMLFLCIAVILIKGGYTYGITTGRFKKRV